MFDINPFLISMFNDQWTQKWKDRMEHAGRIRLLDSQSHIIHIHTTSLSISFSLNAGKMIKFNKILFLMLFFQVCGWNWFLIFNVQFILHTDDCTHALNSVMSFWLFLWGRAFTHCETYILGTWAYYIDWRKKERRKTRTGKEEKENVKKRKEVRPLSKITFINA